MVCIPKLIKLDCHDPQGAAERYERAVKMAGHVQMISYAKLDNQRWVAFVHNGYTMGVVLSHGLQYGECTCEDFKKNHKTCKHIYAVVLAINKIKDATRQTYEEKYFKRVPSLTQMSVQVEELRPKLAELSEKIGKSEPFVIL